MFSHFNRSDTVLNYAIICVTEWSILYAGQPKPLRGMGRLAWRRFGPTDIFVQGLRTDARQQRYADRETIATVWGPAIRFRVRKTNACFKTTLVIAGRVSMYYYANVEHCKWMSSLVQASTYLCSSASLIHLHLIYKWKVRYKRSYMKLFYSLVNTCNCHTFPI